MKSSVLVNWKKGMAFESQVNGHSLVMDTGLEQGGNDLGMRPKPLLMVSLAGCTGMDVVSLLKKMKIEIDDLKIWVEGDITEEHPKHYTHMHLIYEFKGENLPLDKLNKAVDLSQERYCGVSASLRNAMGLSFEVRIV